MRTLLLALAGIFISHAASAVGFNCNQRLEHFERMICADPALAALDDQLNATYRALGLPTPPDILRTQRAWSIERRRCDTPACLSNMYHARINELSRLASNAPNAPVFADTPRSAPGFTPAPPIPGIPTTLPNITCIYPGSGYVSSGNSSPSLGNSDTGPGKTPEELCSAVDLWTRQLDGEFGKPGTTTARYNGQYYLIAIYEPVMFAGLLREDRFKPYFGRSAEQMTERQADAIVLALDNCRRASTLRNEDMLGRIVNLVFLEAWPAQSPSTLPPDRARFRSGMAMRQNDVTRKYVAARQQLAASVDWLSRLDSRLRTLPPGQAGLRAIATVESEAQPHIADLWPSERAGFTAAINRQREAVIDQMIGRIADTTPLSDLASLDRTAAGLDERSAAQIRSRINAALARRLASSAGAASEAELAPFRTYPALQNARPELAYDPASPPDRTVWEGRFKCGPSSIQADLVIKGPLKRANQAFLLLDRDRSDRNVNVTNPVILEYQVAYDDVLDSLRLNFRQITLQGGSVSPTRTLDLALQNGLTVVTGRLEPSCEEFSLSKKTFSRPTVAAVTALQNTPSWVPATPMAMTTDPDATCLALAGWAKQIEANAGSHDLTRGIGGDPVNRLFAASLLHPSFAMPYTGRDLGALAIADRLILDTLATVQNCQLNPLVFEHSTTFRTIYNVLNDGQRNVGTDRLRDIETRTNRVGQAADRFTADRDGFDKLTGYITPFETELAPAVKPVRDALLVPARKRLATIAGTILAAETAQPDLASDANRLIALEDVFEVATTYSALVPQNQPILQLAGVTMNTALQAQLREQRRTVEGTPQTLAGFRQFIEWRSAMTTRYGKFMAFSAYKDAMAETDRLQGDMQAGVAEDVKRQIAAAATAPPIRTIRITLDELDGKNHAAVEPLWAAYRPALDQWFTAAVARAPQAPTAPEAAASNNPLGPFASLPAPDTRGTTIFTSPNLKEAKLTSAIYRHDFRALYRTQERTNEYLFQMLQVIGPSCPGTLPGDLVRAIMRHRMGNDIFTNNNAAANYGGEMLLQVLREMGRASQSPGRWMDDQISQGEFIGHAQADAQAILQVTPCDDPAMKTFLSNTQEFYTNPSAGVPSSELGMVDMCRQAQPQNETADRKAKYCSCAGPILEQRMTPLQQRYVRLDARSNFWNTVQMVPGMLNSLGKCAL